MHPAIGHSLLCLAPCYRAPRSGPSRAGAHLANMLTQAEESPLKALVTLLALLAYGATALASASQDPRLARDAQSPEWLAAVGRLEVPGHRREQGEERHHIERCSATLVSPAGAARAEHIVTAWHCLEWYDDLSQPIVFSVAAATGEVLQRTARPLASGGSMAADWAVLRLLQPVPLDRTWRALAVDRQTATPRSTLWMAGYSREAAAGQEGTRLTYHPDCRVTTDRGPVRDTDCRASKGASGGAVIRLDPRGGPHLTGVISAGDGVAMTRFVPVTAFVTALPSSLR